MASPQCSCQETQRDICLCVDLRALNKEYIVDRFPLPNIGETISTLANAKYFSTLDLTAACHQVELDFGSQKLTAFIIPMVAYTFKRMPIGLASAASVFR